MIIILRKRFYGDFEKIVEEVDYQYIWKLSSFFGAVEHVINYVLSGCKSLLSETIRKILSMEQYNFISIGLRD